MKKVLLLLIMLLVGSFSLQAMDRKEIKTVNELKTADLADGIIFLVEEIEDLSLLPNYDPPCSGYDGNTQNFQTVYFDTNGGTWVWIHKVGGALQWTNITFLQARVICSKTHKLTKTN